MEFLVVSQVVAHFGLFEATLFYTAQRTEQGTYVRYIARGYFPPSFVLFTRPLLSLRSLCRQLCGVRGKSHVKHSGERLWSNSSVRSCSYEIYSEPA